MCLCALNGSGCKRFILKIKCLLVQSTTKPPIETSSTLVYLLKFFGFTCEIGNAISHRLYVCALDGCLKKRNAVRIRNRSSKWTKMSEFIWDIRNENTEMGEAHFECIASIPSICWEFVSLFFRSGIFFRMERNWCASTWFVFFRVRFLFSFKWIPRMRVSPFRKVVSDTFTRQTCTRQRISDAKTEQLSPNDHCPTFYNLENYEQTMSVLCLFVPPCNSTETKLLNK